MALMVGGALLYERANRMSLPIGNGPIFVLFGFSLMSNISPLNLADHQVDFKDDRPNNRSPPFRIIFFRFYRAQYQTFVILNPDQSWTQVSISTCLFLKRQISDREMQLTRMIDVLPTLLAPIKAIVNLLLLPPPSPEAILSSPPTS